MITFMRCFPNPFHHSLGVSAAPENRLHHLNFMVSDIAVARLGGRYIARFHVDIMRISGLPSTGRNGSQDVTISSRSPVTLK